MPFYSGRPVIDGLAYPALTASDFPLVRDGIDHLMGALSIKSRERGTFDWEVAVSGYDYRRDLSRISTTVLPGAAAGGAGRITDLQGTGWDTLALRGVWRPDGDAGPHVVDLGVQQDRFRLRQRVDNTDDWIGGAPTTPVSGFEGDTRLQSLFAQDTWDFAPRWKAVLGARLEHWTAVRRRDAQCHRRVQPPRAHRRLRVAESRARLRDGRALGAQGVHRQGGAHAHRVGAVPGRLQLDRHRVHQQRPQPQARAELDQRAELRVGLGCAAPAHHAVPRGHAATACSRRPT